MKIHLLVIFLFTGLMGCVTKNNEETARTEIAIEDLKLNAIVHDSLTTKQMDEIERIHQTFSEVNSSSLDETIDKL